MDEDLAMIQDAQIKQEARRVTARQREMDEAVRQLKFLSPSQAILRMRDMQMHLFQVWLLAADLLGIEAVTARFPKVGPSFRERYADVLNGTEEELEPPKKRRGRPPKNPA